MDKQLDSIFNNTAGTTAVPSAVSSILSQPGDFFDHLGNPGILPQTDTLDWFKKLSRTSAGSGSGISAPAGIGVVPSSSAGSTIGAVIAPSPWHGEKKVEVEPHEKFANEMEVVVNQIPTIKYSTLISNMRAAIAKATQTGIELRLFTNFDKDTNVVTIQLLLSGGGVEDKALVKVTRVMRRPDESVAESMLAEIIEICMMRGIYNMVKAELGLDDNPEI